MASASPQPEPKQIKVQLLLTGGHEYTLYLSSDSPLLRNLFSTLLARSSHQATGSPGWFQIPIHENHAALCFPGDSLVGLITEPPLLIQSTQPLADPSYGEERSHPVAKVASTPETNVLQSQYVQLDQFLPHEDHQRLLKYVLEQEEHFVPTSTSTGASDYRRSMILYAFPEFSELMRRRISKIVPEILQQFQMQPFPVSQIEAQLTAHNNGNYYKVHNDNGSPDTAAREFTYVYYFYQEPKAFSGGELKIYDSQIENGFYVQAESFQIVEPRNNSIVFFRSHYLHEVLPVQCPSQRFANSRFTINGWIHR